MQPISSTFSRRRVAAVQGSGSKPRVAKPSLTPGQSSAGLLAAADQKLAKQRDDLIVLHMPMATRIARSYAGRGVDLDDLTQVAMLELVRVAGRFDATLDVEFAHYAFPCILGAVKKHFRDNGWSMHDARRMQELDQQIRRAIPGLTQLLGRTPTVPDLADQLHLSEEDIRDALQSRLADTTRSLDQPATEDGEGELGQLLGGLDRRLEAVPDRQVLAQYTAMLPERERSIVYLRFTEDLTQREIAERLGISQMHVSRLLSQALKNLRTLLLDQP
jgi:RNA polymerase sigma-B factor